MSAQLTSKKLPAGKSTIALFLAALTALILMVTTFVLWQSKDTTPSLVPARINKNLLFTPYMPKELPNQYTIISDSFTEQEGALLFSAVDLKGQKMIFSEQSMPKNFNLEAFYQENMIHPVRIGNLAHTTILGKLKKQPGQIISIAAQDTWIIITAPESLSKADASLLSRNLQRID